MILAEQIHQYQLNSIDSSLRADMKCAEDDFAVRILFFCFLLWFEFFQLFYLIHLSSLHLWYYRLLSFLGP